MSPTTSALILAFVAIVALGFVAAGLLERVHALEQAIGTAPGRVDEPGRRLDGPEFAPDGRPVVLLIASPGCQSCDRLVPALDRLLDRGHDVRVLWEDEAGLDAPSGVSSHVITRHEAVRAGATATPYALVVDAQGGVRWAGAVADIDRLTAVVDTSVSSRQEGNAP